MGLAVEEWGETKGRGCGVRPSVVLLVGQQVAAEIYCTGAILSDIGVGVGPSGGPMELRPL